ncbi:hypothetical protein G6F60_015464 [Rhizopus arrhizus]|nr:hypothetical protein G6F59_018514 [Rhizopus arrhizus]KAG1375019.1 hypothetical protein G6F60_015464 [Rhizopus arrhizus]
MASATASKSLISCSSCSPDCARVADSDTVHGKLELISTSPSSRPAMATTAVFTGWPRPEVKSARIAARLGYSAQA